MHVRLTFLPTLLSFFTPFTLTVDQDLALMSVPFGFSSNDGPGLPFGDELSASVPQVSFGGFFFLFWSFVGLPPKNL